MTNEEEGWGLFNPAPLVKQAFAEWEVMGFDRRYKPTREQVEQTDPSWDSDLLTMYKVYKHQKHVKDMEAQRGTGI